MYNTRRSGPGGGNNQNISNIGSRRSAPTNFVPGGQLQAQRGGIQQPLNRQQQMNKQPPQATPQVQQQQPPPLMQQQQPPPLMQQQQQQPPPLIQQQQQQQPSSLQQQKPLLQQTPQQQPALQQQPIQENMESDVQMVANTDGEKKKWMHRKIPKKERMKRRNMRLGKLLQPKSAMMILNELIKNLTYNVDDSPIDGFHYRAFVVVEGIEHSGTGKSKAAAKNSAAEAALRYLVKNKNMSQLSFDGDEKMDTTEENEQVGGLPWQQVASFALFKLFNEWGGDVSAGKDDNIAKELKPAKKLPDNAVTLNPIMVINQMFPGTLFKELPQTGISPNVTFNMQVTVNGETFTGSGSTKKLAKRNASFAMCSKILNIQYPPEVYTPLKPE